MAYNVPDPYRQAIRSGLAITYTVSAKLNGVPVVGAQGMEPTGGTITDTTKPGVRRVLNLSLAPARGLFDLLSPVGTQLHVTAHVQYHNKTVVDVPMGVFDVDSEKLSESDGGLSLTAPDKWVKVQRARFIGPAPSYPNSTVVSQITQMIRDVLGNLEPVKVLTSNQALLSPIVWEKDRDKAIIELARDIGCWVYFDRSGVATIADVPTAGAEADWLVDASASGVLTELDRERSRSGAFNVVVVSSSATDEEKFPTQYVWDDDPGSPTYAGTDPLHAVNVGPFGIVPYYHDTSLPHGVNGARELARALLARLTGLASSVSLGQVPNPAVDAFDVIDVLPPGSFQTVILGYEAAGEGFGTQPFGTSPFGGSGERGRPILGRSSSGAVIERHIVDTVTHPLSFGPTQTIEGRSTRYDEIGGGS